MILSHKKIGFAMVALLCSTTAFAAQDTASIPVVDPSAPGNTDKIVDNPLVTYLVGRDKITKAEAEERVAIQGDIVQLLTNPVFAADPNFADLAVQSKPVYRIYLTYFDNDNKAELLKHIPARMRRYVQIKKAKRNKNERTADLQALRTALAPSGVRFATAFDEISENLVIITENATQASQLQALIPVELKERVEVSGRGLPKPQVTTGSISGYPSRAGYGFQNGCTLGYPITYTYGGIANRKGILTAGHCTNENRWVKYTDNTITTYESPAIYSKDDGNYDFGIYDNTGMISDYKIWYRNKTTYRDQAGNSFYNYVPQFPDSGELYTQNFIRRTSQWKGMNICKNGAYTGLTCAKVNYTTYDWRGTGTMYVYVDESTQENLSIGGDSGAPWFTWTNPSSSPYVSAVGLHVAGWGAGFGGSAIYMPIDRIFEAIPGGPTSVRLVTSP